MISNSKLIYILIVNYYSFSLIARLIQNFLSVDKITYRIIIVNNSPKDKLNLEKWQELSIEVIEAQENLGFGNACNLGLKLIYQRNSQAIVWLVNPDTLFDGKLTQQVLYLFEQYPQLSILGTTIYTPDSQLWFAGGKFKPYQGHIRSENLFSDGVNQPYVECDWVSGCSLIINLSHFPECPQFDPKYFLYYEDFDFCQRYQCQGHLVAITNEISIFHEVSAVTNRNQRDKFYHSTYSYLLTLQRYSNKLIFSLRLIRLLIIALLLFPVNRAIALGKITGVWHFVKKHYFYGFFLGHC